jgi:ADP-ribose pyrophosphatase YjhB (NUDIX family)
MDYNFCPACSVQLPTTTLPVTCPACHETIWDTPACIGVGIVPVTVRSHMGLENRLLATRRAIAPVGLVCLPGGHKLRKETWQQTVAREVLEECGVIVNPETMTLLHAANASNGNVLLFALCAPITIDDPTSLVHDAEVQEILFLSEPPPDPAFPTHAEMFARFFAMIQK